MAKDETPRYHVAAGVGLGLVPDREARVQRRPGAVGDKPQPYLGVALDVRALDQPGEGLVFEELGVELCQILGGNQLFHHLDGLA